MQDAKEEFEKIEAYRAMLEDNDPTKRWNLQRPSRQRIKDDLKMIRRLSLELEKEAEGLW